MRSGAAVGSRAWTGMGGVGYDEAFEFLIPSPRSHAGRRFDAEQPLADIDAATPVDLSVLYESWFYVSLRPQLKLTSEQSGDQLLVQVQSNLPFGRLDVPIEIRDQNGARRLQLQIQDETGRRNERVSGRAGAKLDPDNVLLLRR